MLIDAHYYIQAIYLLYIYGFRNQAYLLNYGNMELDAQLRLRGEKDCWEFRSLIQVTNYFAKCFLPYQEI